MATVNADNLYAVSRTERAIQVPEYDRGQAYAAYTVDSAPAPHTNDGWAPTLDYQPGKTPDPQRVMRDNVVDMRPPAKHNSGRWYSRLFKDRRDRETVVNDEALPFQEAKGNGRDRFAPNPRATPTDEPRWTTQLAPTGTGLTRPMNGGIPSRLDGSHFSMADHRRSDPDIYGMAPPRSPRSTYRLDSLPWGEEVVDMPAPVDYTVNETIVIPPSAAPLSRSHRLV